MLKKVYFQPKGKYNETSKVDGSREVSHLGKGVNERTHSFCGAPFGPLLRLLGAYHERRGKPFGLNTILGLLLQIRKRSFFMNKTQKLCATAMLVALSVVANAFSIQLSGSNYLSFTYVPSFVSAIYLGIIPAAAVGFLGDLIAGFLFPKGAYNILIGLASTLIAVIPAILYKFFPKHRRLNLCLALLLCTIVCTSGLNTYAMWLMYGAKNGDTFWVYLGGRLPFQLLNTVANGIIVGVLQESRVIDRLFGKLSEHNKKSKKYAESKTEIDPNAKNIDIDESETYTNK